MRGMGRIFQRGSVYHIGYFHRGREYRESSHSEKEAVARRLLKKRLGEIGTGKLIGPSEEKVTFDEMAQDLIRDYQTNGRKVSAVQFPISRLTKSFGFDKALDITTDRIRKHIANRQEERAANATINRELAALKRMFSLAIEACKLSRKPHIPTLEENNARQGFLDHAAFLALSDNLPEHLKDPVSFLYRSGWRVSEMRSLEWRDIDLAGKTMRLRPELSKNKDGRVLKLKGEILAIIERAKAKRRLDLPYVFHHDGQPIGDFRKAWQTACVIAGLGQFVDEGQFGEEQKGWQKTRRKKYTGLIIHDLRRTAVRNMVRAGINERVAMARSGHKTRNVFDRYNIVSESDLDQAEERMEAYLESQPREASVKAISPAKKAV